MPTELECPSCQKRLRANDGLSGSQALCPFCRTVVNVPAAEEAVAEEEAPLMPPSLEPEPQQPAAAPAQTVAPAAAAPTADQWWAQTKDGQQYGPVPKAELDGWVADGSVNAECQILRDGEQQWQWASEVYPQLAQPQ